MIRHLAVLALLGTVPAMAQVTASGFDCRKVLPPHPSSGEQFGSTVAVYGDFAAVGSLDEDQSFLYQWTGLSWAQIGEGLPGFVVALNESLLVTGSPFVGAGRVEVFRLSDGSSFQTLSAGTDDDRFGFALALEGDHLAVGAPRRGTSQGAVYVYDVTTGELDCELGGVAAAGDQFGTAVALSEDDLVVGAPFAETGGAVYVYDRQRCRNGQEPEPKILRPQNPSPVDAFGFAVAAAGDTIVVGAPQDRKQGVSAGAVYFFTETASGDWSRLEVSLGGQIPQAGDQLGIAVAFDGENALAGARRHDEAAAEDVGAVYLFQLENNRFTGRRLLLGEADDGEFGVALALDGERALVGAHRAGAAYSFAPETSADLTLESSPQSVSYGDSIDFMIHTKVKGRATLSLSSSSGLFDETCTGSSADPCLFELFSEEKDLQIRGTYLDAKCEGLTVQAEFVSGCFNTTPPSMTRDLPVNKEVDLGIVIEEMVGSGVSEGTFDVQMTRGKCSASGAVLKIFWDPDEGEVTFLDDPGDPSEGVEVGFDPIDSTAVIPVRARLADGRSEMSFVAAVSPPDGYTNTHADCAGLEPYATPDPGASCAVTRVVDEDQAVGLSVEIRGEPGRAVPGEDVSYDVKMRNSGPQAAPDAPGRIFYPTSQLSDVTLTCPGDTFFSPSPVSAGPFSAVDFEVDLAASSGEATCQLSGRLNPETTSAAMSLVAWLEPPAGLRNSLNGDGCDDLPGGVDRGAEASCDRLDVDLVRQADLSIQLGVEEKAAARQVVAGDELIYTLVVRNNDWRAVGGVRIRDEIDHPEYLLGAVWSCGTPSSPDVEVGPLPESVELPRRGSFTCQRTARVNPGLGTGSEIVYDVFVEPPEGLVDPDTGNNQARASVTVVEPADLGLTLAERKVLGTGQKVRYVLDATLDAGPTSLEGVQVAVSFRRVDGLVEDLDVKWTCSKPGCAAGQGRGPIDELVRLTDRKGVTYRVTVRVPQGRGYVMEASIRPPEGMNDVHPENNRIVWAEPPSVIPALSPQGLLALALLLAVSALWLHGARRP